MGHFAVVPDGSLRIVLGLRAASGLVLQVPRLQLTMDFGVERMVLWRKELSQLDAFIVGPCQLIGLDKIAQLFPVKS